MKYLISIIIPAYNVEYYLSECLESVIKQTYKNWEIILVNDGSRDNTKLICDKYSSLDFRIHVIHKENTGVSDSRNIALSIAKGDYIMFLDADDYWCDNNILEKLISLAIKYDIDLLRGEYLEIYENKQIDHVITETRLRFSNRIISSYEFLRYAINKDFFLFLCLFKSDILKKRMFEVGRIYLEDMRFYSLLLMDNDIRCIYKPDYKFYVYRKNINSVSLNFNPLKLRDSFDMCIFFNDLSNLTKNDNLNLYFHEMSLEMYYMSLKYMSLDSYYYSRKDFILNLDLNQKWKLIRKWIIEKGMNKFTIIYFLPPYYCVFLFRLKRKISLIKMNLLNYLKSSKCIFFIK